MIQPLDIGQLIFKLVFNDTGLSYDIDMPNGFLEEFKLVLEQENYARELSFGDSIKLEFNNEKGTLGHRYQELLQEYNAKAWEGDVDLQVFFGLDLWFVAELQFETAQTDKREYISFDCDIKSLKKIIESRKDVKVDLLVDSDLDGNPITPITTNNVILRSKEILKESSHVLNDTLSYDTDQQSGRKYFEMILPTGSFYHNPFLKIKKDQSDSNAEYLDFKSIIRDSSSPGDRYNYEFPSLTRVNIKVSEVDFRFNEANNNRIEAWNFGYLVYTQNNNSQYVLDRFEILQSGQGNIIIDSILVNNVIFQPNTRIFFCCEVGWTDFNLTIGADRIRCLLDFDKANEITLEEIEIFPSTNATMVRLINAGRKILENYTNGIANVSAPRFGSIFNTNAEFWDYFITTGYYLRGFENRQMPLSFKEWKEQIQTAFNCDVQINGNNIFIGKHQDFYTNIEVARLEFKPDTDSYTVIPNEKRTINKFQILYKNYEDDDKNNTLDAFHTESEWFVPNRKVESENEKEIPFTSDAYAIEYARREGINVEPTTAKNEDDDWYLIDTVSILGLLNNRTNEGFSVVENLFSPNTTYNLKLSLKRLILDHWAFYLAESAQNTNNGSPVPETEVLKNQFFKANGQLITQASAGINTTTVQMQENENLIWADLPNPIIDSFVYEFTLAKRLKFNQLRNLFNGVIDQRGYITLYQENVEIKVYPIKMEYDLDKEELNIKGELKWT